MLRAETQNTSWPALGDQLFGCTGIKLRINRPSRWVNRWASPRVCARAFVPAHGAVSVLARYGAKINGRRRGFFFQNQGWLARNGEYFSQSDYEINLNCEKESSAYPTDFKTVRRTKTTTPISTAAKIACCLRLREMPARDGGGAGCGGPSLTMAATITWNTYLSAKETPEPRYGSRDSRPLTWVASASASTGRRLWTRS